MVWLSLLPVVLGSAFGSSVVVGIQGSGVPDADTAAILRTFVEASTAVGAVAATEGQAPWRVELLAAEIVADDTSSGVAKQGLLSASVLTPDRIKIFSHSKATEGPAPAFLIWAKELATMLASDLKDPQSPRLTERAAQERSRRATCPGQVDYELTGPSSPQLAQVFRHGFALEMGGNALGTGANERLRITMSTRQAVAPGRGPMNNYVCEGTMRMTAADGTTALSVAFKRLHATMGGMSLSLIESCGAEAAEKLADKWCRRGP
jgi:hypothetical protein